MAKREKPKFQVIAQEKLTEEEIEQMIWENKQSIEDWILGIPLTSFEVFGLRKIVKDVVKEAEQMRKEKSGMNFASYFGEIAERFLSNYYGLTIREWHKIFKIGLNDRPTEESKEYFHRKQKEYYIN